MNILRVILSQKYPILHINTLTNTHWKRMNQLWRSTYRSCISIGLRYIYTIAGVTIKWKLHRTHAYLHHNRYSQIRIQEQYQKRQSCFASLLCADASAMDYFKSNDMKNFLYLLHGTQLLLNDEKRKNENGKHSYGRERGLTQFQHNYVLFKYFSKFRRNKHTLVCKVFQHWDIKISTFCVCVCGIHV